MIDFYFFVKTFLLTIVVVLLLQIQIGKKTIETHMHDFMQDSLASGFLDHAAHGGAHILKDATHQLAEKMKENIGLKHKQESVESKASSFHWFWDHTSKKTKSPAIEDDSDTD